MVNVIDYFRATPGFSMRYSRVIVRCVDQFEDRPLLEIELDSLRKSWAPLPLVGSRGASFFARVPCFSKRMLAITKCFSMYHHVFVTNQNLYTFPFCAITSKKNMDHRSQRGERGEGRRRQMFSQRSNEKWSSHYLSPLMRTKIPSL